MAKKEQCAIWCPWAIILLVAVFVFFADTLTSAFLIQRRPFPLLTADWNCGISKMGLKLWRRTSQGTETNPGDYPWVVELNGCTGSLISRRHVLVAAHCAFGDQNSTTILNNLTATIHDLSDAGKRKTIKIIHVALHRFFDKGDYRTPDIGIFTLETETSENRHVCLPSSYNEFYGDVGVVVGYSSHVAKEILIPLNPPNKCEEFVYHVHNTKNKLSATTMSFNKDLFICGGSTNRGTYGGDSGGPLMKNMRGRWYQIGVTSYGSWYQLKGHAPQDFGAYLRISEHCTWIKENTQGTVHCIDAIREPPPPTSGRRQVIRRGAQDVEYPN